MFKVTNQIAGKWKTRSILWQILQLLFLNSYFPSPPKKNGHEFNLRAAQYCINKIFELTKSYILRFQNGFNKVVIEPHVMQFWSEIILVISNLTHAARLINFEITHMISAQIALHSVQLPLLIIWANIKRNAPLVVWRGNDKHSTTLYFPSFNTAEWKC